MNAQRFCYTPLQLGTTLVHTDQAEYASTMLKTCRAIAKRPGKSIADCCRTASKKKGQPCVNAGVHVQQQVNTTYVRRVNVALLHIAHDTSKGLLNLGVSTHTHIPYNLTSCRANATCIRQSVIASHQGGAPSCTPSAPAGLPLHSTFPCSPYAWTVYTVMCTWLHAVHQPICRMDHATKSTRLVC